MELKSNFNSVSEFLKSVYLIKKAKNKKYYMRAFARDLDLPAGRLSEIFANKRNMTLKIAHKVADVLMLNDEEKHRFYSLVQQQQKLRTKNVKERNFIPAQEFNKICHWQYYALLGLLEVSESNCGISYYSEKMGIPTNQIEEMLLTLERLKIIFFNGEYYEVLKGSTTTTQDVLDKAIRGFHKELVFFHMLQVEHIAIEKREMQSLILPVEAKNIIKAKKFIRSFLDEFEKKFVANKNADVYGLSLQLSPLTQIKD